MLEFSRPIAADRIQRLPREQKIAATPEECALLATRLGLESLGGLSAEMTLKRVEPGEMIRVQGRLVADVIQHCVVSLEPVPEHVETDFEVFFAESIDNKDIFSDDGEGGILAEPIEDGQIDLGELVAQNLSLALNPYPRSEKAELLPVDPEKQALFEDRPNPFLALKSEKKS